jgi:hypothetical protein
MKKLLQVALVALFGLALLTYGFKATREMRVSHNNDPEVVLVDFENSGEPEYVAR